MARKLLNFKGLWLRESDLNRRPLGYEPNELPDCSTPHIQYSEGDSSVSRMFRPLTVEIGADLLLGRLISLVGEQRALPFDSPAVTRQRSVLSNDSVAGNRHRDPVGSAGLSDCP